LRSEFERTRIDLAIIEFLSIGRDLFSKRNST
jgi:hypothetical protein